MQHKTFEQWLADEKASEKDRKYASPAEAIFNAVKRAWEFQRELAQPMADQIDAMSRAFGRLPAPMACAVMDWKGEEVPDDVRLQADQYEDRLRQAMVAAAAADPEVLGGAETNLPPTAADAGAADAGLPTGDPTSSRTTPPDAG